MCDEQHHSCKGNVSRATVGRNATEQVDTCGAAASGWVREGGWVGYIQTSVQAHQARQCDQKSSDCRRESSGWVVVVVVVVGGIQTSELRARQLTTVEVRTDTPLVMQLGRPMLKWSSGAAGRM
jgi:hypothetical protein